LKVLNLIFYPFFIDGDKDKEDIRRGIIGADDAGGRQKLLRTIRSGEYKYQYQIYIITLHIAKLKLCVSHSADDYFNDLF